MIELIFILIIAELIAGVWLIVKMNKLSQTVDKLNNDIKQSGFSGNLTELRLALAEINHKLVAFREAEKQKNEAEEFFKVVNVLLFIFPVFDLFFKKGKKHK